jgi:guanylate kinase
MNQPLLIVLTGPSGCGKTTLYRRFLKKIPNTARVITTTTRLPRPGEIDHIDYHFITCEAFLKANENGEFLEYARVYNNYYGISKSSLQNCEKKDLILSLDVQGAQTFKANFRTTFPDSRLVTIFIIPESLEILKQRLISRGTDDAQTIQTRLRMAETELTLSHYFDYHIQSRDQMSDWRCLQYIYFAEKMRS